MATHRATYCGPLAHLQNQTALVQWSQDGTLLAQFNDSTTGYGFGWTAFPPESFTVLGQVMTEEGEQQALPLEP